MELRNILSGSDDIEVLERINEEAIPDQERNSIKDMLMTGAELIGIYIDDEPSGFILFRKYRNICYLAYLAVKRELRSKGIGSAALRDFLLKSRDMQVVVEFEASDDTADDKDIRKRRRDFYLRNGFHETGWYTYYDDTEFEIACSDELFDFQCFERFTEHLSAIVSDHIPKPYRKDI